jgi:hypothetical protein
MVFRARRLLLALPLLLGACDCYELVKVDSFPYGNQRTAGSGYAYVLAKMMPVKDTPILKAVTPRSQPQPMPMVVDMPAQDADEVFRAVQSK